MHRVAVRAAVGHELPIETLGLGDDLRVRGAKVRIDVGGAAHAVLGHPLHDTESADSVAVVAAREGDDVGNLAVAAGYFLVEREVLKIDHHPERDSRAVGPLNLRTVGEGNVGERTGGGGLHMRLPKWGGQRYVYGLARQYNE